MKFERDDKIFKVALQLYYNEPIRCEGKYYEYRNYAVLSTSITIDRSIFSR